MMSVMLMLGNVELEHKIVELQVMSPAYRGTSLIRNCPLLGPYSSPMPRDLR